MQFSLFFEESKRNQSSIANYYYYFETVSNFIKETCLDHAPMIRPHFHF